MSKLSECIRTIPIGCNELGDKGKEIRLIYRQFPIGGKRQMYPFCVYGNHVSDDKDLMAASKKLKILCLHGYRQDAESFKDKIGGFRKSIKNIAELVFVNAPNEIPTESCVITTDEGTMELRGGRSWWFCDSTNDFSSRTPCTEVEGFKESVNVIAEAFRSQGPFDGILGFSQGGALAALICALKEHQEFEHSFDFVVIIAGFKSIADCHQYLYSKTINIQSLHIIGENDSCISRDRSEQLIPLFKSSSVVYHDGGHFIPSKSSVKAEYLPFFKNLPNICKDNI